MKAEIRTNQAKADANLKEMKAHQEEMVAKMGAELKTVM
jgi:hypothetical protein